MNAKMMLPVLAGLIIVGISQFAFAEESEKVPYVAVDKEQFEQPQSRYNLQEVTITGYVENYSRGDIVTIEVVHPDETQEELQTHATKKGEIYILFQINGDSQIGIYKVILKYNGVELASTSFEILENK